MFLDVNANGGGGAYIDVLSHRAISPPSARRRGRKLVGHTLPNRRTYVSNTRIADPFFEELYRMIHATKALVLDVLGINS